MQENEKVEKGSENAFWELIKIVAISLAIVLPIRTWVAQPFIVSGASMEPNFHNGEYLIIDELTYQFNKPKRGDVIVFRFPLNPREFFIKRIVGLPAETVEIENGKVKIKNGNREFVLDENYISPTVVTGPDFTKTLNENMYFVMGDNRIHSSDSRTWGELPADKIIGRALLRLWPPTKAQMF